MILEIEGVLITEDVLKEHFACALLQCKGACCEEGEVGAPLEWSELPLLQEQLEHILPFLPTESRESIPRQGFYELDEEGAPVTQTHHGKACVFASKNQAGTWQCGIEKAWKAGACTFRKPISCHLYPIRVQTLEGGEALNYHRWDLCTPACAPENHQGLALFRFLKEPLIRKYGLEWYRLLEAAAERALPDKG